MFSLRGRSNALLQLLSFIILEVGKVDWKADGYRVVSMDDPRHVHSYVKKATLNIGAVFPIHDYSETQPCGEGLRETGVIQYVEAMVYAIDKVNANPDVLQGIELGFVILDDCSKPETALERALHFMPIHSGFASAKCDRTCRVDDDSEDFEFYDVIGLIGAESTPSSMQIANILGMFSIPQISPTATSDLLSDKNRFPYFMRMVPPDRYQVQAILNLILHFKWTYISVVYSQGGYGEEAQKQFKDLAKERPLCIGGSFSVSQGQSRESFLTVVRALHKLNTTVVVLFTDQDETRGVLQAVVDANLVGRFVWVGSDGMGYNIDDLDGVEEAALGSLSLKAYSQPVNGFDSYFESLHPGSTDNPWFHKMWADMFNCSWNPQNGSSMCQENSSMADSVDYGREDAVSTIIDTVNVFARALDRYINDVCPNAKFLSKGDIHNCIRGEPYLEYLKNVTFVGHNGKITFDKNGDARGKYEIINYQRGANGRYKTKRVAIWDVMKPSTLNINDSEIKWYSKVAEDEEEEKELNITSITAAPESNCGQICKLGEIYSYFRDTCCWECRPCNKNEITVSNHTKCSTCQTYTWPDQRNFSACNPLEPHHVRWTDPAAIVLLSLAVVGVSYCTVVFCLFIRNNNARLIKATSRELSYIMLGGATMQYILIFTVLSKPSEFVCFFNSIGFNVSFAVVYAPLLTRTNRIYRIFNAGKRTKALPSFTSSFSQIVIALILILCQVVINIMMSIMAPPKVTKLMPEVMEPFVELTCAPSVYGFVMSLSYNVLLIIVCTYYAFRTRKLPDNFNESRYITLCVYTTLIIWLTFLPTYFTTTRAFYQVILISCALLLNGTVMLLCLYTTKLFALLTGAEGNRHNNFKYNIQTKTDGLNLRLNPPANTSIEDQNTELTDFINNSK